MVKLSLPNKGKSSSNKTRKTTRKSTSKGTRKMKKHYTKTKKLSVKSPRGRGRRGRMNKKQKIQSGFGYDDNNVNDFLKGKLDKRIYETITIGGEESFYHKHFLPIYQAKIDSKKKSPGKSSMIYEEFIVPRAEYNSTTVGNGKNSREIKIRKNGPMNSQGNWKLLNYIKDDFVDINKTPMYYYKWWEENVDKHEFTKDWQIFEDLKSYLINLFISIINSYLKYETRDEIKKNANANLNSFTKSPQPESTSKYKERVAYLAKDELTKFIEKLNSIDMNESPFREYFELFQLFASWYDARIKKVIIMLDGKKNKDETCDIEYIKLLREHMNKKYEIVIPISSAISEYKFTRCFAAPIYLFGGRHMRTHYDELSEGGMDFVSGFIHPCDQLFHDLDFTLAHLRGYMKPGGLDELSDIKTYYKEATNFLMNYYDKVRNMKDEDMKYIKDKNLFYQYLFYIFHEHDSTSQEYISKSKKAKSRKFTMMVDHNDDIEYEHKNHGIIKSLEYLLKLHDNNLLNYDAKLLISDVGTVLGKDIISELHEVIRECLSNKKNWFEGEPLLSYN